MKWRPLTSAESQLAWVWGAIVLSVFALRPFWPMIVPLLRRCAFREFTGLPCPTCGSTRGAIALLDGRILDALAFNPLVMASGVAFVVGGLVAPIWAWRAGTVPDLDRTLPKGLRLAMVAMILVNWAYLIVALPVP